MPQLSKINLPSAIAIVVANMIGTGVFTSLGYQLVDLEPGFSILFLWLIGGVLSFCGALCYAEIGAMIPRSGGEFRYLSDIFHPALGFLAGWVSITIGFAAPIALAAMAFASYFSHGFGVDHERLTALAIILIVTALHFSPIRRIARIQHATTLLKLFVILLCIGAAFFVPEPQNLSYLPQSSDLATLISSPFAISLVYVMYAYAGWNAAAYIASEIHQPQRNLPRALLIGTTIVTILYIALNLSFLHAAPASELAGKTEVALHAAFTAFGIIPFRILNVLICIGLISTTSALTWAGSRVAPEMATEHPILGFLAKRNQNGIPTRALLLQTAIAIALILTSSFEKLLTYIEGILLLSSLLVVVGLIVWRIRRPDANRPFRCPLYPIPPLLFIAMTLTMLFFLTKDRSTEILWGIATLTVGFSVYLLGKWRARG